MNPIFLFCFQTFSFSLGKMSHWTCFALKWDLKQEVSNPFILQWHEHAVMMHLPKSLASSSSCQLYTLHFASWWEGARSSQASLARVDVSQGVRALKKMSKPLWGSFQSRATVFSFYLLGDNFLNVRIYLNLYFRKNWCDSRL